MNQFIVFNENNYNIDIKRVNRFIKHCIKKLNMKKTVFNIIFIDDNEMRGINKKYRNIDNTTDVISFALEDSKDIIKYKKRLLGDIYISHNKVIEQAKENNVSEFYEMCFLIIHGILHLLGYNHEIKKDEDIMFKLQEDILYEFKK